MAGSARRGRGAWRAAFAAAAVLAIALGGARAFMGGSKDDGAPTKEGEVFVLSDDNYAKFLEDTPGHVLVEPLQGPGARVQEGCRGPVQAGGAQDYARQD